MDLWSRARVALLVAGLTALSTTPGMHVLGHWLVGAESGRSATGEAHAAPVPLAPVDVMQRLTGGPNIGVHQPPPAPAPVRIKRASVATSGAIGNNESTEPSISADGRFVVFTSTATNLAPLGDTNGVADIFVRDLINGTTERVSTSGMGAQANGASQSPTISPDGRYVVFSSTASNLTPGDTNGKQDVFLKDLQTSAVERISVGAGGVPSNENSWAQDISADGRYILFDSLATNLGVQGAPGVRNVYLRDRQTSAIHLVSLGSNGIPAPHLTGGMAISADARFVAFTSSSNTLVPVDTNAAFDAFVRDRQTSSTTLVSSATNGAQGQWWQQTYAQDISADGRYVVMFSMSDNFVPGDTNGRWDVFVKDRQTGMTERISVLANGRQGELDSTNSRISQDGRYVLFITDASRLWPNDTNDRAEALVKDRQTGTMENMNLAANGTLGNDGSALGNQPFSGDARYVAFASRSSNLVPNDTNGTWDVYVVDRSVPIAP